MSLICPISNGMFSSQSDPKVLLDPSKGKLHKIGRKSTKSSLESKTQILYVWNNYSKMEIKKYIVVLQHGFHISCKFRGKIRKNY